jgi:hypothetical protein
MDSVILVLGIAAKYILPILFIPFPFFAGWANFILDSVDGDILIPAGLSDPVYQRIDKSADWFSYVCAVVAAWKWPIRKIVIALFVFRSIGQGLFFLTENEIMFFLFPNFLEPLFLAYATILLFKRAEAPTFYRRHAIVVWVIVVLYKMQDEYITHVGNVDRTELIRGIFS